MSIDKPDMTYTNRITQITKELLALGHKVTQMEKQRALLQALWKKFLIVAGGEQRKAIRTLNMRCET